MVTVVTDDEVADLPGARVGRRVEETKREAERDSREPEHAAELPPADTAHERHAGSRRRPSARRVGAVEDRLRLGRPEPAEAAGEGRVRARQDRSGE